jgi:Secretion system C-terminal sorting domain
MIFQALKKMFYVGTLFLLLISNANGQVTVYNNFGAGQDGWDYTHTTGWTISGYDVAQQYGVEQAMGFESTADGMMSDIWLAVSYCTPSSLPDTVVVFLVENPDGLPPDSANIIEEWTIAGFGSWSQWNTPFHLEGNGTSYLQEGKSYWLWAIGKETTWTMWCLNEDPALTCPHTIRRENEDWLNISNETAGAFRVDVICNVGISTPGTNIANSNVLSNYPNPFHSSTTITYSLKNQGNVKLIVADMYGREVQSLVDAFQLAGEYSINYNPDQLPNGIYFCKLLAGNQVIDIIKMSYQR